ncbi:hypothetical protein J2T60_001719 [Natronospira proteinivora]|uniref:DUF3261 domain-containing protein n=1 Tax=Natronospira proteinivora TaxID=1807133 RepID=A0ABT1G8U1_9GAMM|nr:DUF3261 domain-containing protein [Natronospira proteinivora]MCP1727719.1 hypothetical protein [Natronospira proteinivora]
MGFQKPWRLALLCLLLAALTACAPLTLPDRSGCERLHARLAYCLLTPAEMGRSLERLDRVQLRSPAGRQDFIGQLAVDEKRFLLAAQSLTGMALFRVEWDGEQLSSRGRFPDEAPEPIQLLALLQLLLAEPEDLNRVIYGGHLEVDEQGDRRLRLDNGRVILRILRASDTGMIEMIMDEDIRITLEPLSS